MPNLPILSFNTGEVSPLIDARSDVSKYASACRILENKIPRIYGIAQRRPGTKFISLTINPNALSRLLPFIYSEEIAYIIEMGDRSARFYFDGGTLLDGSGNHVTISTPYLSPDLREIQYKQSNDVMWLVHKSYIPRKLTRTTATSFDLSTITFTGGPFLKRNDLDTEDGRTLTPSSATGTGTLTASADTFLAGHIGSIWKLTQARVNTDISGSRTSTGILGSPMLVEGVYTFSTSGTWKGTVKLQRSTDAGANWETVKTYTQQALLTKTESETNVQYRINVTSLTSGTITATLSVNSSTQDGIVRITAVASATSATYSVDKELASTDATLRWAEGAWSGVRGYPRTMTFFEERAVYASTLHQPQTIWLSASGLFECFSEGTADSDAFSLTLSSDTRNAILWITALEALLFGTSGGEWRLRSSRFDEPLTPTNYSMKQQTTKGSKAIQALQVDSVALFVDSVGRKVREMSLDANGEKYVAPDLNALAEHITVTGIVEIAHQKNPDSILWAVRTDGVLLSMTYEREQDVVAWARHPMITGGEEVVAEEPTEPVQIRPEAYAISNWFDLVWFDPDFEVLGYEFPSPNISVCITMDVDSTGIVVVGYAHIAVGGTRIARWDTSLNKDTEFFVPDAGWEAGEAISTVRFTDDDAFLYAGGNKRFYKFDAVTGAEVWHIDSAIDTFGLDSVGNVYTRDYNWRDGAKYDADGNFVQLYTYIYPGEVCSTIVRYGYYDEELSRNMCCGVGLYAVPGVGNVYYHLMSQVDTDDDFKRFQLINAQSTMWMFIKVGDYYYTVGDRCACGIGGANASVLKLDTDFNIIAHYDNAYGYDSFAIWEDWDGNLAVQSGTFETGDLDSGIWLLDTDLNYISNHNYNSDGSFGNEGVRIPYTKGGTSGVEGVEAEDVGVNSVAVIPGDGEDEVWLIVAREINGQIRRFVEQMQPRDFGNQEDAWFSDAALDYSGVATDSFTGLDHLEGEEVVIWGNGAVFTRKTVTDGAVALDSEVTRAIVGLPYRYKLKPMRFDLQLRSGTTKGSIKKIGEVVISFFESLLAQYGKDVDHLYKINWRTTEPYDSPPDLYTGDKVVVADSGFDAEDGFMITGDDPAPCSVRAIILREKVTGR